MTPTAATKAPAKKKAPKAAEAAKRGPVISDAQKQAMQVGRQEGAAIRRYLEAIKVEQAPKRRGRRRSPDQIRERLVVIDNAISQGVDPLEEINLRQERLHLLSDLEANEPVIRSTEFEEDFVKAVKPYSERKGITFEVWREFGVSPALLRKAGLRSSR